MSEQRSVNSEQIILMQSDGEHSSDHCSLITVHSFVSLNALFKVFVLVLGFSFLMACQHGDKKTVEALEGRISQAIGVRRNSRTEPVKVSVQAVRPAEGGSLVGYVGRVEPTRSTLVSLPHGGTLVSLRVREGQRVNKGDILAEVRNESLQAAYDMAASTLHQAEDGFARVQKVYDSGSITEQKYIDV